MPSQHHCCGATSTSERGLGKQDATGQRCGCNVMGGGYEDLRAKGRPEAALFRLGEGSPSDRIVHVELDRRPGERGLRDDATAGQRRRGGLGPLRRQSARGGEAPHRASRGHDREALVRGAQVAAPLAGGAGRGEAALGRGAPVSTPSTARRACATPWPRAWARSPTRPAPGRSSTSRPIPRTRCGRRAAASLARSGDGRTVGALARLLGDPLFGPRENAARALGELAAKGAAEAEAVKAAVRGSLNCGHWKARWAAADLAAKLGDIAARPALEALAASPYSGAR